jgi:hydrogenase maturation protease
MPLGSPESPLPQPEPVAGILLIGYGNPARQDDGLGLALAQQLAAASLAGLQIESDYQLSVEYAWDIARYKTVIFVDASLEGDQPFSFQAIAPQAASSFFSHSLSPQALLFLAEQLFEAKPRAYLLAIRGYCFDQIEEGLSEAAEQNLQQAEAFICRWLEEGSLECE